MNKMWKYQAYKCDFMNVILINMYWWVTVMHTLMNPLNCV